MPRKATGRKPGRPGKFSREIAAKICAGLCKGTPLTVICRGEGMPAPATVRRWMTDNKQFEEEVSWSRERGFDALAWKLLSLAKQASVPTLASEGGPMVDKGRVLALKLECDVILKLLSKWDPKRYGDKVTAELSGPDGKPIEGKVTQWHRPITPEFEAALARAAVIAAGVKPPASFQGVDTTQ